MRLGRIAVLLSLIGLIGLLGYGVEISLPRSGPKLAQTLTPTTTPAPDGIGSYDVLGVAIDRDQAASLLQTSAGQQQLSRENGAIEITQDLIDLGRKSFYTETFGNEYVFTNVIGAISPADQTVIVQFLVAIDDVPAVLPTQDGEPLRSTSLQRRETVARTDSESAESR